MKRRNIYIPIATLLYIMVQKSSFLKTLEVFFIEPTKIHFIKEISKKTEIAHTSIKNNIDKLLEEKLIIPKESRPFNGYVANRDNPDFIFYKKIYNLYSLKNLKDFLNKNHSPKLTVIFGSYSLGEDIETSDIDILIITKEKEINLKKFEKELKREINIICIDNLNKLEKPINKIQNGFVLTGGFDNL
jgi:predicted nucleotidyltransferase